MSNQLTPLQVKIFRSLPDLKPIHARKLPGFRQSVFRANKSIGRYTAYGNFLEKGRRKPNRNIFDPILRANKSRASVHFLVNMLEAYYFADADRVNAVLATSLQDDEGDIETQQQKIA